MMKKYFMGVLFLPLVMVATQISHAQPGLDIRETGTIGKWHLGAVYQDGAFKGCLAGLDGNDGPLMIKADADKGSWGLIVPAAGLPSGNVRMREQHGNESIQSYEVRVDAGNDTAYMEVHDGWLRNHIGDLENYVTDSDYRIWLGNRKMKWHFTHANEVGDMIHECIDSQINPGSAVKQRTVMVGSKAFQLKNSGMNRCLMAGDDGQVSLTACSGNAKEQWTAQSDQFAAGYYYLTTAYSKFKRLNQCLAVFPSGGMEMLPCKKNYDATEQGWRFIRKLNDQKHLRLINVEGGNAFCLEAVADGKNIRMASCANNTRQAWLKSSTAQRGGLNKPRGSVQSAARPQAGSNSNVSQAPRYGAYTAISINRSVVQGVIAEGNNLYVKLAPGIQTAYVKISDAKNDRYRKWGNGADFKQVQVYRSNERNKKGYTYRVNSSARFFEYYVNGQLVLHLEKD